MTIDRSVGSCVSLVHWFTSSRSLATYLLPKAQKAMHFLVYHVMSVLCLSLEISPLKELVTQSQHGANARCIVQRHTSFSFIFLLGNTMSSGHVTGCSCAYEAYNDT